MKHTLFFIICFVISIAIYSQKKCGTTEVNLDFLKNNQEFYQRYLKLETETQSFINNNKSQKTLNSTIYTIPVVIHVYHNGEPIGNGPNISDNQILSQLDALNNDFRLLNLDALPSSHPFWPVTADCEIQFCLAEVDTIGNPTTGITRHNIGVDSLNVYLMDSVGKPETIWDPSRYLNIWTMRFGYGDAQILGYATFPWSGTDSTDGVVMAYDKFGTIESVIQPYHLGRTLTHEVGHYLNLRHIWGDAQCGNDSISDTEVAEQSNAGNPTFPHNANSVCGSGVNGEMYMNYMDYSDDSSLVMFTQGQKNRMQAALSVSRQSLLVSNVCTSTSISNNNHNNLFGLFSIFPNPSNGDDISFNADYSIDRAKQFSIRVIDITGKIVFKIDQNGLEDNTNLNIEMKDAPSGLYSVSIYVNQEYVGSKKIIVIR